MSLRRQVMRGGAFLVLRQGAGVGIGVAGVLLLTRAIGPKNYGLYAAAFGLFAYLQNLTLCGINVYLVRREGGEEREVWDQASTLLLLLGIVGATVAISVTPALERWVRLPGLGPVARIMFVLLPVVLAGQVALARLERRLDFVRIAMLELVGQLVYFVVALPLAFRGFGVWAPTLGWVTQQVLLTLALLGGARYLPRPRWDSTRMREMIAYGMSFSSSAWAWHLRMLVNPLVVGKFLGAEAVGIVALTIRLVEYLSFVKAVTWRLSIAALARLRGDYERLRSAVSEGIGLQVVAVGPLLVAFGWVAPWAIPLLFGRQWLGVLQLYPFVALGYLANAMFTMHSSTLYVLGRNWEVATFHVLHVVLFAGAALLLVPRVGLIGYGLAELAALVSYAVLHYQLAVRVGRPEYRAGMLWGFAFGAALFYRYAWWTTLALALVALVPSSRVELAQIRKGLQKA
jgi:O-antigen/teichoic acid export membrane protein